MTTSSPVRARSQDANAQARPPSRGTWWTRDLFWYVAAVLTGAVLVVTASINQPLNQNELLQIGPYGSDSFGEITSGTRQPPIDPLLGSLVQHLLGVGQLRQRLVPALAAIGTLVLLAVLLRRLKAGIVGAGAVLFLATMPLFVRYSAYTRPYALPLFLMMAFVVCTQVWLDTGRRRWLFLVLLAAAALPATRVTEPTFFLGTTILSLLWQGRRGRIGWNRAGPVIGVSGAAIVLVAVPMVHDLSQQAPELWDPNPAHVLSRFDEAFDHFIHDFLALMRDSLPVWPLLVVLVVLAFCLPESRQRLCRWWFFWPLLAPPVIFALAYHFITSINLTVLPYHARGAYFFTPAVALVIAALALAAENLRRRRLVGPILTIALVGALLVQIPAAVDAATRPDVPDYAAAGQLLEEHVPAGAVVLYDRPTPPGFSHQRFQARGRYLPSDVDLLPIASLPKHPDRFPREDSPYVMIDGNCTPTCGDTHKAFTGAVAGWRLVATASTFSLYAPKRQRASQAETANGLLSFSHALGPQAGWLETFAAAALLRDQGSPDEARRAVDSLYRRAGPDLGDEIRADAEDRGLRP